MSVVVGMHWAGGGVQAFLDFLPSGCAYFFVCLHCNSKRKLQLLVLMLSCVCLFVIVQGFIELRGADLLGMNLNNYPYLLPMTSDTGELFFRLKGLGMINDPNDLGQLIVCVLPLLFIFWTPKRPLKNIPLVILPACVLLLGVFLTHSRGALLALLAIVIVALRRRIGTVPSLLLAGGLFAAASAAHFTGGREISAAAGEDRTSGVRASNF